MNRRQDTKNSDAQAVSLEPLVPSTYARRRGKIMIWLGFVLPLSLYASIVLLAPLDVLDQFPRMRQWADQVHGSLLAFSSNIDIYKHARSTAFPQVAMLTSAMAVLVVLFMALSLIVKMTWDSGSTLVFLRLNNPTQKDRFGGLFIAPFGFFCFWAFYCLGGDPSFGAGYTTEYRSGYLFISGIAILLTGIGVGCWPAAVRLLISDIFSKGRS